VTPSGRNLQDFARKTARSLPDVSSGAGVALEVRPAGLSDVATVVSLERQSGRSPLSLLAMEAAVIDSGRHVVVASVDGTVIGWGKPITGITPMGQQRGTIS
jgi:hypothetical protein